MGNDSLTWWPQQLGYKFDHTIKRSKVILVSYMGMAAILLNGTEQFE